MAGSNRHDNTAAREVAALAWAGRQAEVVAAADTALAAAGTGATERFELLELRAESLVALGDLARADADAEALKALARRERNVAMTARAQHCAALVQMRGGDAAAALKTARRAVAAARRSGDRRVEARALTRLAEAQFRLHTLVRSKQAMTTARRAVDLAEALGDKVLQGRALWCLQAACNDLGRGAEADRAGAQSLVLARATGDLFGQATALNSLTFNESDVAAGLRLLKRALSLFRAAGFVERQAMVTSNLAGQYVELGLYRQAKRLEAAAIALERQTGARHGLAGSLWKLAQLEATLGHADAARALAVEAAAQTAALGGTQYRGWPDWIAAHLATQAGRPAWRRHATSSAQPAR
ncbi:MAG: hypothetical protein IPG91_06830 [Ideonella sp.]|nr:hypothetical protein [Ideonella sp.]